jgi:phospholipid/cholesterol/gamma-HCH transport system permease protein
MMTAQDIAHYDAATRQLHCQGDWDIINLPQLKTVLSHIHWPQTGDITFDGKAIRKMDSAGAWLIDTWQKQLQQQGLSVRLNEFSDQYQELITLIETKRQEQTPLPVIKAPSGAEVIGKQTIDGIKGMFEYFNFVGLLSVEMMRILRNPSHLRFGAIIATIYRTGYQALPIMALLSLLVGVVIAYQMGLQLKTYGANIYIVDFLGLSILREFGPLMTAIMVAGRTGSAFTAQIGMMKLNQEIDALDTMGVTPAELLILPRIIGLFIALPLLTVWSDIFGIVGGMVMSNNMLHITTYDFLHRFPRVIPLKTLIVGLGKTPFFALIIASVGCFEGMKVQNSADSLGRNTTRSVVLAIFFIIVADAFFSIIFSKLKL